MKYLLVLFVSLAAFVVACTETGAVGESFLPNDIRVRIDTFLINNAETVDIPTFSTSSAYLSSGSYNDPLFGKLEAVSYFVPLLEFNGIDTLNVDSLELRMEFVPNPKLFYGDTTQINQQFGLYFIQEDWRAGTMTHNRVLRLNSPPFATFIYSGQSKIDVTLPNEYVAEIIRYQEFPDSTRFENYISTFPGIAIKAIGNSNLIVPFYEDSLNTRLTRTPSDTITTVARGTYRAAYSVEKETSSYNLPSSVQPLGYDWKPSYAFNFFARLKDLGQYNLSSAFLQINAARDILEETLPEGHVRPEVNALRTFIKRPSEVPFSFVGETPDFNLVYVDTLGYYIYNMNSINDWKNNFNLDTTLTFYVVPNIENGILYQTLIYNKENSAALRPRVVLTRVEPLEGN